MAGIADSHRVIGDVLHHDAAAADDHIAADGHARHHLHACADPDIVPHRDRVGILKPGVAALEVDGVTSGVETAVRRNKDVIAEFHLSTIKDDQVVVGVEIFAQFDVVAIIAPERRSDIKILPRLAEKFLQDRSLALFVRRAELIILPAQLLGCDALIVQLLVVVCVVHLMGQHLLFFGHFCISFKSSV